MTSISSTSTNPLLQTLQAQGVSANKANLVEQDLEASIQQVAGTSGGKPDIGAVRSVLDQKISADVAAGKLTQADADKINQSLDDMTAQAGGTAPAGGAQGASGAKGAHHGGGGGGGGAAKTEVSSTTTVSGGVATTTITYSDGSSVSTTTVATADQTAETEPESGAKQAKATEASARRDAAALAAEAGYGEKLDPGSIVDGLA